jgi:hypothetical protein
VLLKESFFFAADIKMICYFKFFILESVLRSLKIYYFSIPL